MTPKEKNGFVKLQKLFEFIPDKDWVKLRSYQKKNIDQKNLKGRCFILDHSRFHGALHLNTVELGYNEHSVIYNEQIFKSNWSF
jgi:hypothetical protein